MVFHGTQTNITNWPVTWQSQRAAALAREIASRIAAVRVFDNVQRAPLLRVLLPGERCAHWPWIEECSVDSFGHPCRFCCSTVVEAVVPEKSGAGMIQAFPDTYNTEALGRCRSIRFVSGRTR